MKVNRQTDTHTHTETHRHTHTHTHTLVFHSLQTADDFVFDPKFPRLRKTKQKKNEEIEKKNRQEALIDMKVQPATGD